MDRGAFMPVAVRLYDGTTYIVSDVIQAGDFLLHYWPGTDSHSQCTARRACLKFMEGRTTPDQVRRAFERAAKRAGILMH
jgi:hypothetical protein